MIAAAMAIASRMPDVNVTAGIPNKIAANFLANRDSHFSTGRIQAMLDIFPWNAPGKVNVIESTAFANVFLDLPG